MGVWEGRLLGSPLGGLADAMPGKVAWRGAKGRAGDETAKGWAYDLAGRGRSTWSAGPAGIERSLAENRLEGAEVVLSLLSSHPLFSSFSFSRTSCPGGPVTRPLLSTLRSSFIFLIFRILFLAGKRKTKKQKLL